jgi:hypothetical protein
VHFAIAIAIAAVARPSTTTTATTTTAVGRFGIATAAPTRSRSTTAAAAATATTPLACIPASLAAVRSVRQPVLLVESLLPRREEKFLSAVHALEALILAGIHF